MLRDRALVGHPEDRSRRELSRDPEHHGSERRDEDRSGNDVGDVERIVDAEAFVLDIDRPRPREGRVQDAEIVAHVIGGTLVRKAENVLDDPVMGRSQTQREATFARRFREYNEIYLEGLRD